MSKRKKTAEAAPATKDPALSYKRRRAMVQYIAIMFVVAFLLVLLSMFIQLRKQKQLYNKANQENLGLANTFSSMQDQLADAQTENTTLQTKLTKIEKDLQDLQKQLEEEKTENKQLKDQLSTEQATTEEKDKQLRDYKSAVNLLLKAQSDHSAGRADAFAADMEQLAPLSEHLDESCRTLYQQLLQAYQNGE